MLLFFPNFAVKWWREDFYFATPKLWIRVIGLVGSIEFADLVIDYWRDKKSSQCKFDPRLSSFIELPSVDEKPKSNSWFSSLIESRSAD